MLTGLTSCNDYPEKLRRVVYRDPTTNKRLVFLTNNFLLAAKTTADLYKTRSQIELFIKWIKQYLRIKAFFGTSDNAVKSQIWIAVSIYILVAIIKKRLGLQHSLYTILQILSVSLFDNTPILLLFRDADDLEQMQEASNQLNLF